MSLLGGRVMGALLISECPPSLSSERVGGIEECEIPLVPRPLSQVVGLEEVLSLAILTGYTRESGVLGPGPRGC